MMLMMIISRYLNTLLISFYKGVKVTINPLIFIIIAHPAIANNLVIKLDGELPKAVKNNVLSYLGQLPATHLERSAFIYSAKKNTSQALQSLGYYQANIVVSVEEDPWQLKLTIELNEPTLLDSIAVRVEGEAKNDPAFIALLKDHPLQQGDKLHHGKYQSLKANLLSLALQRGYFNGALVTHNIIIKQGYRYADITLLYNSGPRYRFGEVSFNSVELDPALLSSLIPFKSNDFFNINQFHQLQNQLQSSQYFGSVIAVPGDKIQDKSHHQYIVPIKVALTPAKGHLFDFGIGYATDTQFRLSMGWRTPLINRYGHYQETDIKYSPLNPTGKFIYSIPLSHPTQDVLQLKVLVENEDYADLTTKFYSAQIGRLTSNNGWNRQVYARLHQEAWRYDLDKDSPNIVWAEEDNVHYIIPGVTWSKTIRRGSTLDPSAGFRQTYNIEGAHLDAGSDNSFFRVSAQWHHITTLKENHRLVSRAELGAIYIDRDAQLAPSLRFYAGGDQSIRGFAYQTIGSSISSSSDPGKEGLIIVGGTRLMVASIEYQYYLNNKWRLALFSDGGSVTNNNEFDPVYSVGTGVHYMSPVGAVKFDVAYGVDDNDKHWRIHINLGAEF